MADTWFDRRTYRRTWDLDDLLEAKDRTGTRVSLVVPAVNEAATVGDVVGRIHQTFVQRAGLVDELVVIDGGSTDDTVAIARAAGADVHHLGDIRPDLGARAGKGESIWKSQFVTSGDLLVFVDADLTEWDTHFVTGLLGPLLTDSDIALVKGFYERPFRAGATEDPQGGGRATELVARPLLALARPDLGRVIQPLAGEWAVRRAVYESLHVPAGYGVDLAALIDVSDRLGIEAIAQVDLGRRAHSHQRLQDLGPMAVQLTAAVMARSDARATQDRVVLHQFRGTEESSREVDLSERPPAVEVVR